MDENNTIKIGDIAKRAGVSITTVSRVMNNSSLVSEKTVRKVRRVIKEANYIPNETARSLVRQKSRTIAIIIPDVSNPFFADIINGMDAILSHSGYCQFLCSTNYIEENEHRYLQEMAGRGVDGIFLISLHMLNNSLLDSLRQKLAFVAFHTNLEGVDTVATDDHKSLETAIDHLVELGHRKLGIIALNSTYPKDRYQCYQAALKRHGLPYREEYVIKTLDFSNSPQQGYAAAKQLLDLPDAPTAILALNDYVAQGIYLAAREMGLHIPADISVVGFDDIVLAQLLAPPLTTVRQPGREVGMAAAELMMSSLERRETGSPLPRTVILPTWFIPRESTAPPKNKK